MTDQFIRDDGNLELKALYRFVSQVYENKVSPVKKSENLEDGLNIDFKEIVKKISGK